MSFSISTINAYVGVKFLQNSAAAMRIELKKAGGSALNGTEQVILKMSLALTFRDPPDVYILFH